MTKKNLLYKVWLGVLLVAMAFPAWGAMSDEDFLKICKYGSVQEVKEALKNGANPNARDKDFTALMFAVIMNPHEQFEIIDALLKAGANVNERGYFASTVLMMAAEHNIYDSTTDLKILNTLLKAGANVNAQDELGNTALMKAASCNTHKYVNRLIKAGAKAKINAKDKENGWTALMWAAATNYNSPEITNILLKAGANINDRDNSGRTPLMITLMDNEVEDLGVINALLKAGVDINAKDINGWTALMWAIDDFDHLDSFVIDILNVLLKAGANINIRDNDGYTALDHARKAQAKNIVKLLEVAAQKQKKR